MDLLTGEGQPVTEELAAEFRRIIEVAGTVPTGQSAMFQWLRERHGEAVHEELHQIFKAAGRHYLRAGGKDAYPLKVLLANLTEHYGADAASEARDVFTAANRRHVRAQKIITQLIGWLHMERIRTRWNAQQKAIDSWNRVLADPIGYANGDFNIK